MENIRPYNENEFMSLFKKTEIYKKLLHDYAQERLVWHKFFSIGKKFEYAVDLNSTARIICKEEFSATIFYYLLPLLEKNPKTIYDLGCGANIFKKYLPNLIGVGAEIPKHVKLITAYNIVKDKSWPTISSIDDFINLPNWIQTECLVMHKIDPYKITSDFYGDIEGKVDDQYIARHQNYFDSVFAINSLHFHPLNNFIKIVLDFSSMISDNGQGFIALNMQRLIERTNDKFLFDQFKTTTPTVLQYDKWLRDGLATTNLNFLILDIDLTVIDEVMDGNIRLVIEK